MRLIDADKFLGYLIFSKHIDSLKCDEVKKAVKMCEVNVLDQIRAEIEQEHQSCKEQHDWYGARVIREVLKIFDKHLGERTDDKN